MNTKPIVIRTRKNVFVRPSNQFCAIVYEELCSTFYFENGESISTPLTLKEALAKLPPPVKVLNINRNSVVSIKKVKALYIEERKLQLVCGTTIEVSVRKMKEVIHALENMN